jgi:hypothetical protein
VHEALDARLQLDERAVVGDRDDLALDLLARRVGLLGAVPGIFHGLLEAQGDALGLGVVLEHLDGDLVADLEDLVGVVTRPQDMSVMCRRPSMPPRSTKAPYSVMFLMTPLTTIPSWRFLRVDSFKFVALLLEEHAARQDDVAALLVELDDLELNC